MAGPGDEIAAGGCGCRMPTAQVIGVLKAAFVQGMLAKDEFDLRVCRAFASRTCAELAAVAADLPAALAAAQPPEPARAHGERPVPRPGRVVMVATVLYAGVWPIALLVPWPRNSEGDPMGAVYLIFTATLVYSYVLLFVLFVAAGAVPAVIFTCDPKVAAALDVASGPRVPSPEKHCRQATRQRLAGAGR